MKATSKASLKPIENEAFWQHHYELQKSSGLSRANYCRQNGLNYDKLGYWIYKWNRSRDDTGKLISVKLKPTHESVEASSISSSILCTLELQNGHCLKIHDAGILAIILERYS